MTKFTAENVDKAKAICNHILFKIKQTNKVYNIYFEENTHPKSKKQLGYLFGGIFEAIKEYFSNMGNSYSYEEIKDWLYDEIGTIEKYYLPNGKEKERVITLSQMSWEEANKFISDVLFFIDESEALQDFVLPPELRYCWTMHITSEQIASAYEATFKSLDEYYLNHQRSLTCIRCGRKGGQAHHIKRGSGLGKKNPDWFSIPICPHCHNLLHHQIGEEEFLKQIQNTINKLDIKDFCRLSYFRWYFHKG